MVLFTPSGHGALRDACMGGKLGFGHIRFVLNTDGVFTQVAEAVQAEAVQAQAVQAEAVQPQERRFNVNGQQISVRFTDTGVRIGR